MDADNGKDPAPADGASGSAQPSGNAQSSSNTQPSGDVQPPASGAGTGGGMNLLDAVQQTRSIMRVGADDKSKVLDAGIGYQKASQAAAFAVQDATDFLRNVMTMAATAEGVALKLMIEHKEEAAAYIPILTAAQQAVTAAATNLQAVGTAASAVATAFPR